MDFARQVGDASHIDGDVILQNGMAKSGNYWLYRCIQALLDEAGIEQRSHIRNHPIYAEAKTWPLSFPEQASIDTIDITKGGYVTRISSRFEESIPDLDAHLGKVTHLWTHARHMGERSEALFEGCTAIVYIYRDPRDSLLSLADFLFSEYGQKHFAPPEPDKLAFIDRRIQSYPEHWARHVVGHLDAARRHPILLLAYEDMKQDLPAALRRIAAALGLFEIEDSAIALMASRLGFSAMKAHSGTGHLNKGLAGRWRAVLSASQRARFREGAGETLWRLGYER